MNPNGFHYGVGVFCSIGKNAEDFLQSLRNGKTGIGPISLFDTSKYPCKIGAEIRDYQPDKFFAKKELKKFPGQTSLPSSLQRRR